MSLGWYSLVKGAGLGVQNCTFLCKSVYRLSAFHFCLFVPFHFSFHIIFFFVPPLYICFAALPL